MENKNIILLKKRGGYYSEQCASFEDYDRINVTSGAKDKQAAHDLSPFFLGPIVTPDGIESLNLENLWQYSKVYPLIFNEELDVVRGVDKNNDPTPDFFEWRKRFLKSVKADRHPSLPKSITGKDCLYSVYYNKEEKKWEKLDYISARKKIYIPEYAKLVASTVTYKNLKERVDKGDKIALVDYDAWNYYGKDMDSKVVMKDVVNNPSIKLGHGFVIKMLLQGDIEVKGGVVIDNVGLLK